MIAWTLFLNPICIAPNSQLWLMLPLFLVVAVIHKTMRIGDLRRLWWEVPFLLGYMTVGAIVLAVALWLVMMHWPGS